jgi:GTP-binding protein
MIRRELADYGHGLADKPEIIGLNKTDAMDPQEVTRKCRALSRVAGKGASVLPLSGVSGDGLSAVTGAVAAAIQEARAEALVSAQ